MRSGLQRYLADVNYLMREPLGLKEGTLLIWAGMRGVVTLAAAQTLVGRVPHASLLILIAFVTATGSLLIQGGTLSWVAKALGLAGKDTAAEGEQAALDHALGEAAIAALQDPSLKQPSGEPYDPRILALVTLRLGITRLDDQEPDGSDIVDLLDETPTVEQLADDPPTPPGLAEMMEQARQQLTDHGEEATEELLPAMSNRKRQHAELRLIALRAMREALLEARALGAYSHATLSEALAVLDTDELGLELLVQSDD